MGMVVRSNIAAVNSQRQLGMNNSQVSKSLEKLSSGFRINRAGDDASGLSISQKMQAQIKGLETASSNSQDSISMIQTAEGALAEVHDMLNRMVEIAGKAANGAMDNDVDRTALQKEIDALKGEIDRISEGTNFNGIKLLDGSLGEGVSSSAIKPGFEQASFTSLKNIFKELEADAIVGSIVYEKGISNAQTTALSRTLVQTGITLKTENGSGSQAGKKLTATMEGYDVLLLDKNGNKTNETDKVVKIALKEKSSKNIVGSFQFSLKEANKNGTSVLKFHVPRDHGLLRDANYQYASDRLGYDKYEIGEVTFAENISRADKRSLNRVLTEEFYLITSNGGLNLDVSIYGGYRAELKDRANGQGSQTNVLSDVKSVLIRNEFGEEVASINLKISGGTPKEGKARIYFSACVDKENDWSPEPLKEGDEVLFDFEDKGGPGRNSYITIGDFTFSFVYDGDNSGRNKVKWTPYRQEALRNLVETMNNDADFSKKYKASLKGDKLYLKLKEKSNITPHIEIVFTSWESAQGVVGVKVDNKSGLVKPGEGLNLQIGDTADEYNQVGLSIGDMSVSGLNLEEVSVADQDAAAAALDAIKTGAGSAINKVSSARAGLGAAQNRLEHTINNLDVAVENMSSANSRIRDTDMAKQMMDYTKMNVLTQAAQAMLAQANQQPQSILQLLQ